MAQCSNTLTTTPIYSGAHCALNEGAIWLAWVIIMHPDWIEIMIEDCFDVA